MRNAVSKSEGSRTEVEESFIAYFLYLLNFEPYESYF
jgi:hypothetical protein